MIDSSASTATRSGSIAIALARSDSAARTGTESGRAWAAREGESFGQRIAVVISNDLRGWRGNRGNNGQNGFREPRVRGAQMA